MAKPRKRLDFPIIENQSGAAALLGVPESLIKAARKKGCKAFMTHGRIDTGILIPFLFKLLATESDIPGGFSSWKEVLESEKARREGIKRQVEEKSLMPIAEAEHQAALACQFIMNELERGERELPPALAGLSSNDVSKRLHSFTESLRENGKKKFKEIGK